MTKSSVTDIEDVVTAATVYLGWKGPHPSSIHLWKPNEIDGIQKALLKWYDLSKRTLPWRKPIQNLSNEECAQRAYEVNRQSLVWVSEIMLQQTQVATVIPYFEKWIEKWPTVHDLAKADPEEVTSLWSGLGYYSRARRLHSSAQHIVKNLNGELPRTVDKLIKEVGGVGRYTAGAIASIGYGAKAEVVDGNVTRVFSRMRALGGDIKSNAAIEHLWNLAAMLLPDDRPGDFNQSLFDLGATICAPRDPKCTECPVQIWCRAFGEAKAHEVLAKQSFTHGKKFRGKSSDLDQIEDVCTTCLPAADPNTPEEISYAVTRYPRKAKKKPPREEDSAVCIIQQKQNGVQKYLLVQRPLDGLLAGLWEFPTINFTFTTSPTQLKKSSSSSSANSTSSSNYLEDDGSISSSTRESFTNEYLFNTHNIRLSDYTIPNNYMKEMNTDGSTEKNLIKLIIESRTHFPPFLHIYSHIRMKYYPSLIIVKETFDDVPLSEWEFNGRKLMWVTEEEFKSGGVSTGGRKAFDAVMKVKKQLGNRKKSKDGFDDKEEENDSADGNNDDDEYQIGKNKRKPSVNMKGGRNKVCKGNQLKIAEMWGKK